jgi:citrate synthase
MAPKPSSPQPDRESWPTALTSIEPNRILVRGYAIDELMGRVTFGDALYLLLTGELPSSSISRLIDAILVGFIDHGVTPPPTLAARQTTSAGAGLSNAVAAGLLGFGKHYGGDVALCRQLLEQGLDLAGSSMLLNTAATDLVEQLVQRDRIPPPGFGHRYHTIDPRVTRLLQIAHELEVDHLYTQYIRAVEMALARHPALEGEACPVNVDGAIAAVCGDLGLDADVAEGLAMISRVPGLIAHALEERTRFAPMRHIDPHSHRYDGPSERRLRERR